MVNLHRISRDTSPHRGPLPYSRIWFFVLTLLVVLFSPHFSGNSSATEPQAANPASSPAGEANSKPNDPAAAAGDNQRFDLHVVGPDGKSVADAKVEIRTTPVLTADAIEQGTFSKKGAYGVFATTDHDGRLVIKLSKTMPRFDVSIITPGFGPYWAGWSSDSHKESVPAHFTAELEAGWSVGGTVIDSEGQPVPGVRVRPNIEFKKRPGDNRQLGTGTDLKTDTHGNWRFDSVPDSMSEVHAEISHAAFMPYRQSLTRSEFEIQRNGEPTGKIVLDRGLTLNGKVTDEAGNPISGALVRTKFLNDIREAKTGDDGAYQLGGCESRNAKIVVSAKGRATDMQEVRIDREMEPVNFQMKPGGTVRIRVLDENDRPVPKARIFFQRWRTPGFDYFEFDHVNQYADQNGVWVWNEAPLDVFEADICRPGGMELAKQSILAREEEYVFHPPAALVVSGHVVDAETKKPINTFRVVPGIRSSPAHMNWVEDQAFAATDGNYKLRQTHDYVAYLVKIEADGYLPAVSRDIKSNEGQVTVDFELKKGHDIAATVLTPDGQPAVGAKIAMGIAGAQINVNNGEIDKSGTYAAQSETDKEGRFHFPPQTGDFQLVITHPAGYAHVGGPSDSLESIELTPWARVEGVFRIGKEPVAGVPLKINVTELHSYGNDLPHIYSSYEVTTAKDGQFSFERVVPGQARIGRRLILMVNEGALDVTSSCMVAVNLLPGETTHIDLGGSGRAVIAQLQPPKKFEGKVPWNFALVEVDQNLQAPPKPADPVIPVDIAADPIKKAAWLAEWQQTEAGKTWTAWKRASESIERLQSTSPRFMATVDHEGKFRIDDVPPGDYWLHVRFSREPATGHLNYRFSVPADGDGKTGDHTDLGVLTLEK